jgi:Holliday junction resolvase
LTRYDKGARSERELLNILYDEGYSVTRSAGSGVNALSPDLVALKKGSAISLECKAWEKGSLSIAPDQFEKLLEWERNSDFPTFVAWRMNGMGWFFIKTDEFVKAKSNWNITKKKVLALNRTLKDVVVKNQEQPAQSQV